MVAASRLASSDSASRPSSESTRARLFSAVARVGQEGVGAGVGQRAADGDGFLDRGQRLLPPAQVGKAPGLVVQRRGEVGQEGVGAGVGQRAADGDGFVVSLSQRARSA